MDGVRYEKQDVSASGDRKGGEQNEDVSGSRP